MATEGEEQEQEHEQALPFPAASTYHDGGGGVSTGKSSGGGKTSGNAAENEDREAMDVALSNGGGGPGGALRSNGPGSAKEETEEEEEEDQEEEQEQEDEEEVGERPKMEEEDGGETKETLPPPPPSSLPPQTAPAPMIPCSSAAPVPSKPSDSPKHREALNREMYRIPTYAGWFSWSKIHNIERRAFSEFFDGKHISKTPKIYKEYRDFIINKYRENLQRPLTFTEARKMLVGDVNTIRRVFEFLVHWGLINYHVPRENSLTTAESPSPMEPVPSSVRVVTPAPFDSSKLNSQGATPYKSTLASPALNLAAYKDSFAPPIIPSTPDAAIASLKPLCSVCGEDCAKKRFECLNKEGFMTCPNCFTAAKYGPEFSIDDFIERGADSEAESTEERWTEHETLLLLDGITKYGEDWNHVAKHVGTKSKAQCIIHFIQLPFGDQFLSNAGAHAPESPCNLKSRAGFGGTGPKLQECKTDNGGDNNMEVEKAVADDGAQAIASGDTGEEPLSKRIRLSPLADTSNPIMAQVAFLCGMVGPRVAAAAAQASVAALAEEDPISAQIIASANHNSQTVYKDLPQASGLQVASGKESVKVEPGDKQDVQDLKAGEQKQKNEAENGNINSEESTPSITHFRTAIATAVGAAAANAKFLADQEEREMEYLMASIIENQLKVLQSKVAHFEELEFILEREHLQIEQARAQVLADRIQAIQCRFSAGDS